MSKLDFKNRYRSPIAALVVVVVAIFGIQSINQSHAQTSFSSAYAADGQYASPASLIAGGSNANSQAVQFGSTSSGTTGTGTSGGGAGNCTSPVWNSSSNEGTDGIDGNYWWVNNDAWSGSAGPQSIFVCNQSSWYVTSDQPNNGGQVETYPDTEYDVGGRNKPSTKPITGWNSITSTFSEAYPSAGSWDAAYDMWTDNWKNETMVWNQWAGTEDFWGDCAEPGPDQNDCGEAPSVAVTIDGVAYHFLGLNHSGTSGQCTSVTESSCELIFFRDSQVASGSVDILAIYQWEVANGYAKATDIPTQLEYGVEVCSTTGTETFPMTGLTFSLN